MQWLSLKARSRLQFLFAFACVFGGLALPSPRLGRAYVQAHAALANQLVEGVAFERGVTLHFESPDEAAQHPWDLTLQIHDPTRPDPVLVPVDLRTLLFLPLAAFIGLCASSRLGSLGHNVRVLAIGLLILVPTLLVLTALPVLSFLGGTGPVRAFRLPTVVHVVFQTLYRALVAPPGMMYAVPLLLWWALLARMGQIEGPGATKAIRSS